MRFLVVTCALVACAVAEFNMEQSFKMVDVDGSGDVSKAEFDGLYATFDDNGDGDVNVTEFITHFVKTNMSVQGSLYVFFSSDANQDLKLDATEINGMFTTFDASGDMLVSYREYTSVMHLVLNQLALAAAAQPSLVAVFDAADANSDGELTKAEAVGILGPADTDGSGMISKDEFVTYWRSKTNDNQLRAEALFNILDMDKDGQYGSAAERDAFFDGFDYGNNDLINKEEYLNSMLNLFAQVMRTVDMRVVMNMMSANGPDAKKIFDSMDTDMNGKISTDEFKVAVNMSDTNGDKQLSPEEFIGSYMKMGYTADAALLIFFASDMNHDQIIDVSEVKMSFHHTDRNMDKHIDMDEFMHVINMRQHVIAMVGDVTPKVANMLYVADTNGDNILTPDEMTAVYAPADTNMDKELSKSEFVKYWSEYTGLSEMFSEKLYNEFDGNHDDKIDDAERKSIYAAFDYNNDGQVTFEEFSNANLYLFAKILVDTKKAIMTSMQGTFNVTVAFAAADTNKDGKMDQADMDAAFKAMDTDANGKLSANEVVASYMNLGLSEKGAIYILFSIDNNEDYMVDKAEFDATLDDLDEDDSDDISREEFTKAWMYVIGYMQQASMTGHKLSKMFDDVDTQMKGNLTADELKMVLSPADTNMDGLIAKDEFKKYWMSKTGEPAERTDFLFGMIDEDDDGYFGNDNEMLDVFDGFDYNDDNVVTKDEYLNSMLNLFVRTIEGLETKRAADTVIGYFF